MIVQMIDRLIGRIGKSKALDAVGKPVASEVQKLTEPTVVRNALSGSWLGHPLHPVLTDVPIGAFTMATALDVSMGDEGAAAAKRLVGLGLLASAPAAWSGASDWSTLYGATQRVGLVHGALNGAATGLQVMSWFARGRGHRGTGTMLSLGAVGLTVGAAYLGGHLSFVRGVGVSHEAFQTRKSGWTDVAGADELVEGRPKRVMVGETPVVIVRKGGDDHALSATCSHAGGPLDEGNVEGDCIECPWHGSRFRLADGEVERGPASIAQPAWHVRTEGDRIQVRPAPR